MKKIALLLAVLFICTAALASCADNRPDNEKIVGEWTGKVDMTESFNKSLGVMGGKEVENFEMALTFKFNEDGTAETTVDPESAKEALNAIRPALVELVKAFAGIGGEELTDEQINQSVDAMFNADEMAENLTNKGKYKIENGKLFMWAEDEEIDETAYYTYEFDGGNKLKLTGAVGMEEGDGDFADATFPIVLNRK